MDISNVKSNLANNTNSAESSKKTIPQQAADAKNSAQSAQAKQAESAVEIHLQSFSKQQLNMTILHSSLASNLEGFSANASKALKPFEIPTIKESDNQSLFDFEEVAKNVLNFVEGALTSAAKSGASQDELNEMLQQARKGVEMGVNAARKELGIDKDSEDELATGINKAHELINQRLDDLYKKFNPDEEESTSASSVEYSSEYKQENNGSISLQTKEGDTVNISFASIQAYQQQLQQQSLTQVNQNGETQSSQQTQWNQAYFQSNSFAFSVEGELNEDELKAIGDLVNQVTKVSGSFYQGDVQAAYQQAQKLGFDDEQISHFAMNLSQKTYASQSYSAVSNYQSNQQNKADLPQTVKQPLNDYVKDLMDLVEKRQQNLAEEQDLESIVNQVFNQQFKLTGNELIDVVNRFNHFNQKILNSDELVPTQTKTEVVEPDTNSEQ
ncbi:DUF5610 domain-containing protein [Catenovulum sp. 2E275]|uniref:DUF5610 domain-containing protein n=1 Tax=Catenovulum sp. 2E275 TaxID=2980497 RepID=UPI0021CEF876|nr:DUF5610 domain-containing protein [Catenovulum sp. 2E275]MCU4676378.1 DUF5610 domain-containing protein [Catenovulum sp. 2E275]